MKRDIDKRRAHLRTYQRTWLRKRREEYFKDKLCEWCGSTIKLEIHHKDPKDKISHTVWSWSKVRRNAELKKCIVVCQKCHRAFHNSPKPLIHGTSNAYTHKKCRCEKCRRQKSIDNAKYRRSKLIKQSIPEA